MFWPSIVWVDRSGVRRGTRALLLGAVAGYDRRDPFTSRRPGLDYTARLGRDIRGVRLGLIRELHDDAGMHPEVKQAVQNAVEVLRQQGAIVQDVSILLITLAGAISVGVADTAGAGARDDILRTCPELLDRASRTRL